MKRSGDESSLIAIFRITQCAVPRFLVQRIGGGSARSAVMNVQMSAARRCRLLPCTAHLRPATVGFLLCRRSLQCRWWRQTNDNVTTPTFPARHRMARHTAVQQCCHLA